MRGSLEGQTLGKYRVLEPLGRGGMARVYRGYHPQLDRFVAIKVLRPDLLDDDQFVQRFRREAQSIASLRHPNIIQVHDFDGQDDTYYMVMELLDGDTLHKRLNDYRVRNQQMPWGDIVRVMADVLDGLGYAHQEGMIHRDIKPSNILLTKRGQVVLADFGIAQIIGGTQHTVTGALLGTLNYMAPEQGLKGTSDTRSDLYSLGIVFYEMLTRRPPFDAETPLAILMKHATDPLPLPREINPQIPQPFERVVLKALAKDPEDRYQSAEEMREALLQAAAEVEIEPPKHISAPLSFNTPEDLSESVAVFSGTERGELADASFADQQTAFTNNNNWSEQIQALKAAEAKPADSDDLDESTTTSKRRRKDKKRQWENRDVQSKEEKDNEEAIAILTAIAIPVLANLLLVLISGTDGPGDTLSHGWPFELFMIALGLFYLMERLRVIWLLIPGGIIFGSSILFAYSSLTDNWQSWVFLWPLLPLLIGFTIWRTIHISTQPDHPQRSREIGEGFKIASLACGVITIFLSWIIY